MTGSIENMRSYFYGVQTSGSIFPAKAEREETRLHSDLKLMEQIATYNQKPQRMAPGASVRRDTQGSFRLKNTR